MGRDVIARLTALAILISILAGPGYAHAAGFEVIDSRYGKTVRMTGTIQTGDRNRLARLLSGAPVSEIQMISPGGNMIEGLNIGQLIRDRRIATRVPSQAECASACFYAFLGGLIRAVDRGGRLGVHVHSAAANDAYINKLKQILVTDKLSIDDRIRLIVILNERNAAYMAGVAATFVVRMGVSIEVFDPLFATHHLKIHWLDRNELRKFNVMNVAE